MTIGTGMNNSTAHFRSWVETGSIGRLLIALTATFLLGACASNSTVPSQATSQAAAQGEISTDSYRISPEDILSISVWREPELQREVTVRPDGGISFPLIGNTLAAGKTTTELQGDITESLSEFVPNAEVSVSVLKINGLKIFVTGKVAKPGQYLVGRYVDVLQALTLAGGLTPFADAKNIRVLRRVNGQDKVFDFNYSAVGRGSDLQQNILLKSGDTVVVP